MLKTECLIIYIIFIVLLNLALGVKMWWVLNHSIHYPVVPVFDTESLSHFDTKDQEVAR